MERKWWTLLAVCLGTFMLLVDITIVNVALPSIRSALHASFARLQWIVDAYALSLAALLLTAGSLADIFGRRLLFAIGLAVFTAGSLLCGLATVRLFLIVWPRRAGDRRRDHVRHLARAAGAGLPRTRARHRPGDLGRGDRSRDGHRPGARRDHHHRLELARDLLREPPRRRRRDGRDDLAGQPSSATRNRGGVDLAGFALFTCGLIALVYGLIERASRAGATSASRSAWPPRWCCSAPSSPWSGSAASRCSTCRCSASRRSPAAP